ncbi:MAG: glycosyltransferase family 39 protein, partial [Actinomycetota bacterium]|nr:glycosyltransferase family 39 protein [Actinomycetota bacterium]
MRMPRPWPAYAALAAIVAAGLLLRLHHLRHGLPDVFHADEAQHFTSRAMRMFGGDLNPHYFQNPSGFTYLLYAVLRVGHGGGPPFDDVGRLVAQYASDPTAVYATGRAVATVLCMLAVVAVFEVGRRLWEPAAGVAAAAVLAFAFLTVTYSRYAVTDTGALLPVAVAVYAAVRAHEDGRLRYFLLAGAAVGLAVGFKYTAGLAGVTLVAAALLRVRDDRRVIARLAVGGAAAAAVFFVTTPFFFLDLPVALDQLGDQSQVADRPKLGQGEGGAGAYYLRSLS